MKSIIAYIRSYVAAINWRVLMPCLLLLSVFIYLNYHFHWHMHIRSFGPAQQWGSWYAIFLTVFLFPYVLLNSVGQRALFTNGRFVFLVLVAPLLFTWKMVYRFELDFGADGYGNAYWNAVLYWPLKLVVVTACLWVIWLWLDKKQQPFYGLGSRLFYARPYWLMLLVMLPLIAAASTQPDFLTMYPKLKNIAYPEGAAHPFYKLLFELSYGSDFFTIELFFRGFLVLAFAKWVGKDAILPMALFYCTIHFGKPLGECISSFFGGLLLGIVTYHTKSIWGGLMVHVGIAWLMEIGGYVGNAVRSL